MTSENENTKSTRDDLSKKYQKKTQLEHIIDLPDTYIGSIELEKAKYNIIQDVEEKKRIVSKEIKVVPGLMSIIEEVLVNAFDNHSRTKQRSSDGKRLKKQTYIKIFVNKETGEIAVENDGEGIDVAQHPDHKIYIPQMIFFELLTSGNYDKAEEKVTGGKNGYGAKLTSIFSTMSRIETVDCHRKLKYMQESKCNMTSVSKPIVEKYADVPFTRMTFIPDFQKFGVSGLSDDLVSLIEKRAYDLIACSFGELKIYFNDVELEAKDINDYISLYIGDGERVCKKVNERWAVGAALTPGFKFEHVSFANSINTHQGGKHVDYIAKQITAKMRDYIKKKKKIDVKEAIIKEALIVFVIGTIVNPSFSSQTKEALKTTPSKFGSTCEITDDMISKLANSCGVMERVLAASEYQDKQLLKKTDGKKKSSVLGIEKLYDAGYAGGKRSNETTLILTEGDSAKATAKAGISVINDGNNLFGIFPLKGKLLNTRDIEEKKVVKNLEITYIKKIMGLVEGKEYKDTKDLRYGRIMIMTDQDLDGSHIKGLLLNFLSRWPSLMRIEGFMTSLLTPIVKVFKGNQENSFYTQQDYEKWIVGKKGWHAKYYKGLGTSTPKEGKEYFRNFKMVSYNWDEFADEKIDMAFNKKRADDRKSWLGNYDENLILDIGQSGVMVSDFINKDLIHYSNYDNIRSLPSIDGLKPSTRKVLFCSFKRNLVKDIKVAQLSGYISEHGAYHHGEVSLQGAIIGMAQDYCGSNNINLMVPNGQFGSRLLGGEDHAACRYIYTRLNKLAGIIYDKRDDPILHYMVDDDGKKIEPRNYMPIIPMILVNGTKGIGTGWSCNIPQYNPLDIVENIKKLIAGEQCEEMSPWYRGFKGNFKRLGKMSWICRGVHTIVGDNTVIISELPIGSWTDNYKKHLDYLIIGSEEVKKDKKGKKIENVQWIKSYKDLTTDSEVRFEVKFDANILSDLLGKRTADGISGVEELLKLTHKMTFKSMNIYDEKKKLVHFETDEDILIYYHGIRMRYYAKRKKYMLEQLKQELFLVGIRVKFILDVIKGKVLVNNVKKALVIKNLEDLDYPKMVNSKLVLLKDIKDGEGDYQYLIGMPIYNLTSEKVEELQNERDKLQLEHDCLKGKTETVLWTEDLESFETEYAKFMKEYYVSTGLDAKIYANSQGPRKKMRISLKTRT